VSFTTTATIRNYTWIQFEILLSIIHAPLVGADLDAN